LLRWIEASPPNEAVATYVRQFEISSILVVANLSDSKQTVTVSLPSSTYTFSGNRFAKQKLKTYPFLASRPRFDIRRPSFPSLKKVDLELKKEWRPSMSIAIDDLTELRDELSGRKIPIREDNTIELHLDPYEFMWLNLREAVFKY